MSSIPFPNTDSKIFLKGPGGQLETMVQWPKHDALPMVAIICHPHPLYGGTMENKVVTTTARTLRHMGMVTVRFNFRGVGESEGQYAEAKGELEDLKSVMTWVKSELPDHQLWLAGFSFGSYIAASAAGDKAVKQLITIAPPVHHYDFINIANPHCPWLVIQGELDEIVPAHQVYDFVGTKKYPITLRKIIDAGHFFHGRLLELRDVLQQELQPQSEV